MRADAGGDRARLAAEALAQARADARARGDVPVGISRNIGPDRYATIEQEGEKGAGGPGARRGRPRSEDPQPFAAVIDGLIGDRGWRQAAAAGSVFGRWAEIVGADLAAHTRPDSLADGELVVLADSTAWATQVRLLAPALARRVNAELGDGLVRRVKVRGPAPPRRRGAWRVRGARGPGDTYG